MTVLKPRSRMISVRLSEDEYRALRERCVVTGARSVSDLTRNAMQALLRGSYPENPLWTQAGDLDEEVKSLSRKLEQLTAEFSSFRTANGH